MKYIANIFLPRIYQNINEVSYNILTFAYYSMFTSTTDYIGFIRSHFLDAKIFKEVCFVDAMPSAILNSMDYFENNRKDHLNFPYVLFTTYFHLLKLKYFFNPIIHFNILDFNKIYARSHTSINSSLKQLENSGFITNCTKVDKNIIRFQMNEVLIQSKFYYSFDSTHDFRYEKPRILYLPILPSLFKTLQTTKYLVLSFAMSKITDKEKFGEEVYPVETTKENPYPMDNCPRTILYNSQISIDTGINVKSVEASITYLQNELGLLSTCYINNEQLYGAHGGRIIFFSKSNCNNIESLASKEKFKFHSYNALDFTLKGKHHFSFPENNSDE